MRGTRRGSRRGFSHGTEFGGSGEDSFVAVVVTKLTGALLFILLLSMVIMALIPRAETPTIRPTPSEARQDEVPEPTRSRPVVAEEPAVSTPLRLITPAPTWDEWLRHGFGFLLLLLVHMVGMNTLDGLQRRSGEGSASRFLVYRWLVRLTSLGLILALAAWIASGSSHPLGLQDVESIPTRSDVHNR
jgi:hypothetical protein